MIKVGIIGVSGYGGGELLRILACHPSVKLTYLTSETYRGKDIGCALPNMRGVVKAECQSYNPQVAAELCDVLFMARDKGWAMKEAPGFLRDGVKIVDLSADYRLKDVAVYEEWYGVHHESPNLLNEAVFGLAELYRDKLVDAQLVANPGCYVTGAILALAPLLSHKLIETDSIIVDSKSGFSGVGRSSFRLDNHFPEVNESVRAYAVAGHRHTPEIEQELSLIAGSPVMISFTPHVIPVTRGIFTTSYSRLKIKAASTEKLLDMYREFYRKSPFVVVLNPGELPATKNVAGSNFCQIGLKVDERTGRVIVLSAIDNLMKGMAGQAVQNMNLMCGLEEATGLVWPGMCP